MQHESPPSQCSPQGCSGLWQQSSVESKPNLEETLICSNYVCLGYVINVSLNCSISLVSVSPSAVILATLQVALTVCIAVTVSFSCAMHLLNCYFAGLVWKDGVNWPSLQTLSLPQQLSPPSQGSLRRMNIASQVSHNSCSIPAAIISWVEAGTLTVIFSTHLN